MIADTMSEAIAKAGGPVALVVQPPARRAISALLRNRVPQALVLSIHELPATQAVEVVGIVSSPEPETAALPAASGAPETESFAPAEPPTFSADPPEVLAA